MTSPAAPPTLDEQSLRMFERKGREDCPDAAAGPNPNAVCVRRIMQLVEDFAHKPLAEVRILDLGCGEGVYAVEAALRGCQVTAVDGRPQRMAEGIECARRNGLTNLRFQQQDVPHDHQGQPRRVRFRLAAGHPLSPRRAGRLFRPGELRRHLPRRGHPRHPRRTPRGPRPSIAVSTTRAAASASTPRAIRPKCGRGGCWPRWTIRRASGLPGSHWCGSCTTWASLPCWSATRRPIRRSSRTG